MTRIISMPPNRTARRPRRLGHASARAQLGKADFPLEQQGQRSAGSARPSTWMSFAQGSAGPHRLDALQQPIVTHGVSGQGQHPTTAIVPRDTTGHDAGAGGITPSPRHRGRPSCRAQPAARRNGPSVRRRGRRGEDAQERAYGPVSDVDTSAK